MNRTIGTHVLESPYILAPMAGVSEQPFRVLAFRMGASLCPTELVSAQGLFRINERTLRYLRFDASVERPYSLQLFGGEPEVVAQAAVVGKKWGADIIDLNMGCPVKKVTKSGAGSALLCDAPRAAEIVRAVRAATGLPVTAKIRSGWDESRRNYLEMADALGGAGVAALAVHPRTRAQGYSGRADWSVLQELKHHVGDAFPVIGNGDVKSPADARRMLDETGCDFVMIGRGALGNPWLFRELRGGEPPTPAERAALVAEHLRAHLAFVGAELPAVRQFRRHLGWYSRGLRGAAVFRTLVNTLASAEQVLDAAHDFFSGTEPDGAAGEGGDDGADDGVDYAQALG